VGDRNDFDLIIGNLAVDDSIWEAFEEGTPGLESCLDLTTAHELGHALGIFQHSPDPGDLMYSDPVVTAPSARDRNTINRAYHTPTTIQLSR